MDKIFDQMRKTYRRQKSDEAEYISLMASERTAVDSGVLSYLVLNPVPGEKYTPAPALRRKRRSFADIFSNNP